MSRIVGDQGREGERAWNILRLGLGALLAMNVMMISLLLYTGSVEPQAVPVFRWVMLALAAPAMAILVYPFAVGAAGEIRRGRLSLDTLIAVGSLAAFAASAGATIHGTGHVYFDTATMLPVLVTFGKLIEATAKTRVGRLVRGLETLLPATALRDGPDGPREAPVSELRVGDRIRVRPGERVAVDGRIIEGATTIEEAAFTGESRPRLCGPGDQVIAGTVNGQGAVLVEAGRIGEDLLAARMIEMVEQARRQASPSQRMAERLAAVFTPLVLALAAVAGLYWFWTEGPPQAGFAALSVLVVACPCAMGIAASLATALAVGRAARAGVLVRGGDVLERAGRIRTVFFDKTGTVTAGRPVVAAVESQDPDLPPEEILGWLAGLESASEHALARAVADEAAKRSIFVGAVRGLAVVPGMGIRGSVTRGGATREIVAGTEALVGSAGPPDPAAADGAATVVAVGWGGRLRGRVLFRDSVRPDAAAAVRALRDAGITPVLLSGDSAGAAQAVAAEVGIDRVEAPRRPDEKIEVLRAAGRAGGAVAMVGDGINDAPALASADVGIAMGAGTDLARQAGHVVLLADRLTRIPWLVALSRQTRRVTRQNLLWAFGYNAAALAAAATGHLHPLLAAVAMVVSSLTVLANSLRLQRFPETP